MARGNVFPVTTLTRRIDAFPATRMRHQLEGVDAVGAVLGGGGDPIAGHAGWC